MPVPHPCRIVTCLDHVFRKMRKKSIVLENVAQRPMGTDSPDSFFKVTQEVAALAEYWLKVFGDFDSQDVGAMGSSQSFWPGAPKGRAPSEALQYGRR